MGPGVRRKRTRSKPDLTVGSQMGRMKVEFRQERNSKQQWNRQQPDLLDGGQGKKQRRGQGCRKGLKQAATKVKVVTNSRVIGCDCVSTSPLKRGRRGVGRRVQNRRGTVVEKAQSPQLTTGSPMATRPGAISGNSQKPVTQAGSHVAPMHMAACSQAPLEGRLGDYGKSPRSGTERGSI